MACLGCEQAAALTQQNYERVKQQATAYGEKNKVDMVIYYTPEGWQYIEASKSAGLPRRELLLYTGPAA